MMFNNLNAFLAFYLTLLLLPLAIPLVHSASDALRRIASEIGRILLAKVTAQEATAAAIEAP